MPETTCDLCGSSKKKPFLAKADRFSGQRFTYVSCFDCGLIYLHPRPELNDLRNYYPSEYEAFDRRPSRFSAIQAWHQNRHLGKQFRIIEKKNRRPGILLDVGCSRGDFLLRARSRGWQVFGIELVEKAGQIARQRGLEVAIGALETAPLEKEYFDVVSLWDVLEHLPSPREALQICSRTLKANGLLVFSIPNINSFDRSLFKTHWIGWDPPRHLTLFSKEHISALLRATGFQVLHSGYSLGGKGAFLLSLQQATGAGKIPSWLAQTAACWSLPLWPYRQVAYLLKRGPSITFMARKVPFHE
jgi:2-polyprenyl-3-methyl-5-hydroxy-6-metoxy-1,4-benzoquinol methylase